MKTLLCLLAAVLSFSVAQATSEKSCDFTITQTMIPLKASKGACLDDYFYERNLAQFSIASEAAVMVRDLEIMQFDDMILFTIPETAPLGEAGRKKLVEKIMTAYSGSLRDLFGACKVNLYDGEKSLTLKDYVQTAREEVGQPGTRLMIKSEDFKQPHWELVCRNAIGEQEVLKQGKYFFIFFDVYENLGISNKALDQGLNGHLAKFLMSYR